MVNKGVVAVGAIGAIAAVSIAAYLSTQGTITGTISGTVPTGTVPTSILSSIELVGPSSVITAGETAVITATAFDQFDHVMPGVTLTLVDVSTNSRGSMGQTGSNGVATADVTFNSPGKYVLYAEG